jgi:peroxiredoxin
MRLSTLLLFLSGSLSLSPTYAQPAAFAPLPLASDFGGLLMAPVPVRPEKLSLETLRQRGQLAEISLRGIVGSETATLAAIGEDFALLMGSRGQELKSLKELRESYLGEAATPIANAALWIANPVQTLPITSLGENAEIVASFVLKNRGDKPLNLSVASTSCGCTAATLEKNRLESGQSTTLKATMHADNERLVRVTLRTGDTASPVAVVALQSKRTFAPFALPAPFSLFGEKGQKISAESRFELPAGWKITRIETSPPWLQTKLETAPKSFRLAVEAPETAPEGTISGRILLQLQGTPLQSLSVPINGFVFNDISASPRMVVLGEIANGIARRTVVVHGPKPFSILAVRGDSPGLKASADPKIVAKAHAVELLIPVEGAVGNSFFRRATLELSDGRELSVDIAGTVAAGHLPALAQNLSLNRPAPTFRGLDSSGHVVSSTSFLGQKNVLLTFFPHCFTGGCESHLASLENVEAALDDANTQIIAVSTDDALSIQKFAQGLKLKFPILVDTDRQISLRYGAVQTVIEAPSRMSVLIDKAGIVRLIDTDVHVQTHGPDMLSKVHELSLK